MQPREIFFNFNTRLHYCFPLGQFVRVNREKSDNDCCICFALCQFLTWFFLDGVLETSATAIPKELEDKLKEEKYVLG